MDSHSVDALQFASPILCLIIWDIWYKNMHAATINFKLHFPVCCHNTFYVCSTFYELFGNEENSKLAETYKINVKCTVWQVTGFLKNYNTTLNFKYTKNQKITFK